MHLLDLALVVAALNEYVRVDLLQRFERVVHEKPAIAVGLDHLRALEFAEYGAERTLIHRAVLGDGDDQHVAQLARGLEMPYVPDVERVPAAMGKNHLRRFHRRNSYSSCW